MGDPGQDARYRAFISYSHVDKAFGRRLHRRLEAYGLPRRLVGRRTPCGPAPRRVAPVFRDREELSAAGDLTAEVRAALAASAALIVVCSPAAAASPWVAREIELFRELRPDRPILAALAHGEPAQAFPAPLTMAGGAAVEPLAADFRPEGDGPRLALLKLVAGVLGLGLDELVQRDAQQRLRSVTAITAGAVTVALAMTGLTTFALLARADAQRQRGQAEALVEFMLTDLRDRLKGVGRLDVLAAVNERTLDYYADQDVGRLPAASRARYARILLAMGEDDMTRGQARLAQEKFRKAGETTARLVSESPNDPERLWAEGQSEYWLGFSAYSAGRRDEAGRRWSRYRTLAQGLVDREPANPRYLRELGYAEGNLCSLALAAPRDTAAAMKHCHGALTTMEAFAALPDQKARLGTDLINRHAWMAEAYYSAGDQAGAMRERLAQERLLDDAIAGDPQNLRLKAVWVVLQKELARLEVKHGERERARGRIVQAKATIEQLIAFEPANTEWTLQRDRLDEALRYFRRTDGKPRGSKP